jgi:hypothetical protein
MRNLDWRGWSVVAAAVLSVLGTAGIYWSGYGLDPATHFGAAFASWVGGLALFLVAGTVVALVSLVRPENESFDARARILFRRQTGKHIDYIVDRIKGVLEHYAEKTTIKVTIKSFNEEARKYRISALSTVLVRSYLDDVETTYISHLSRTEVTAPPPNGEPNRLVFARVAGNPIGVSEEFQDSIERPVSCRIDRNGTCEVTSLVDTWVRADDESNTHTPRRYTQILTLEFENLMPSDRPVEVKLTLDGTTWLSEQLPHGTSKQVAEIKDIKPETMAFDYKIMGP